MSKSAPAMLTMPMIPKKGEAVPAVELFEEPTPPIPLHPPSKIISVPPRLSSRVQATIAVTVQLNEVRYERMKIWGTSRRITNQEVIVAALDHFFNLSDEEREEGIARVRK